VRHVYDPKFAFFNEATRPVGCRSLALWSGGNRLSTFALLLEERLYLRTLIK